MKEELKIDIIPQSFKLQWHITERCNFRCKHCYQENYNTPEISLIQMRDILRQFVELVKKWKIAPSRASLSLGGGEPLLFKDFFVFLAEVYKFLSFYRWDIMSNGSLVTEENAKILKSFGINSFQVSLEGLETNNNKIRGEGNFRKALEGIKILVREKIYTTVGLTLTRENIRDIIPLVELLAGVGVKLFLVRRFVPRGQGFQLINELLEPRELLKIYRRIEEENKSLFQKNSPLRMPLACENAFFGKNPRQGLYCGVAIGRILTLMPNGDVYPCRRLPIKIGNILENSLEEIYYSEKNREIRDISKAPEFCRENCSFFNNCFGGAKCITYAYSGRLDIPDIQCWRAYKKIGQRKESIKDKLENLRENIVKKINFDKY